MTAAGGPSVSTMIDTWAASAALDGVLDDGAKLHGGNASDYQVSTLDESINWDNDQTYSSPGSAAERIGFRPGSQRIGNVPQRETDRQGISFAGASETLPRAPARVDGGRRPGRSAR